MVVTMKVLNLKNDYGKYPKIVYTKVSDKMTVNMQTLQTQIRLLHSTKYFKQLHKKQNSGKKVSKF